MGNSFKIITASPESQLTRANEIEQFLLGMIGDHKKAFIMLDYDFANGLPSVSRQFCSAILYDGFTVSMWTRANSTSSLQTNNSVAGANYWTNTYDLRLSPDDSVTVIIDMNS